MLRRSAAREAQRLYQMILDSGAKSPDRVGKRKGMDKASKNSSDAQNSIDIVSDNG
jgi:hypothetical protein